MISMHDDDYFGRTPAEAMEKLKQRNPDYDHRARPTENPTAFTQDSEWACECGRRIWLAEITPSGPRFTHMSAHRI